MTVRELLEKYCGRSNYHHFRLQLLSFSFLRTDDPGRTLYGPNQDAPALSSCLLSDSRSSSSFSSQ